MYLIIQEKEPSDYQLRNSEVVVDMHQRRVAKDRFGAPEKLLDDLSWAQEIVRRSMSQDLAKQNEKEVAYLRQQISYLQTDKEDLEYRIQELESNNIDFERY